MRDDLDKIMNVMAAAFDPRWGEAWNRRQVSDSLLLSNTHYTLVDGAGNTPAAETDAAGFTLVRAAPGEEELLLVAVSPEARGRGLGRKLLTSVICDARSRGAEKLFLEMRYNNPAQHLYSSLGFAPIGRRPQYYKLPDGQRIDAITFGLSI